MAHTNLAAFIEEEEAVGRQSRGQIVPEGTRALAPLGGPQRFFYGSSPDDEWHGAA
jgi:hypothetical protein